jgi:hypothetical protein
VRLIPKLEIAGDSTAADIPFDGLGREFLVRDLDAREAGAPQNVGLIHEIISRFPGEVIVDAGVKLVHVAELILGLGAARVVVGIRDVATELALRNFGARFGDAAIYSGSLEGLLPFADAGSPLLLIGGSPDQARSLHTKELLVEPCIEFRNASDWEGVRVSGLIVEIGHHHDRSWTG